MKLTSKTNTLSILLLCISQWFGHLHAQSLHFIPLFNGEEIIRGKYYKTGEDSISFSLLKFYVAAENELSEGQSTHHLFDLEEEISHSITLKKNSPSIDLLIGVDSLHSVSGVFSGDLDPINGMYWSWQSGYVNFKLEGQSNRCHTRKNRFTYHIGGYRSPYNMIRKIHLNNASLKDELFIYIHINVLFEEIDLSVTNEVMSPNDSAVEIANVIPLLFDTVK